MVTPDAIHTAAEQFRSFKHRFLLPLLEMSESLDAASDAILSGAIGEAEQRRTRLQGEISALGAELTTRRAEADEGLIALTTAHEAAGTTLDETYRAKHATLERDFTTASGERQAALKETEQQITEATAHLTTLRRQQAEAVLAARRYIVQGAVEMVEHALEQLSERKIVVLDDERRATMVSNLLVVLCGDRDAQPVVNAGSLYQ